MPNLISHASRAISKRIGTPASAASASIIAVGFVLAASGLTRASDIQVARAFRQARAETESVVPYRAPLPALVGVGNRSDGQASIFVIADSSPDQQHRLCDLSRDLDADPRVVLVALSVARPPCGSSVHHIPDSQERDAVHAELRGARFVIVSAEKMALYSRRTVPSFSRLNELVEFFSAHPLQAEFSEGSGPAPPSAIRIASVPR